MLACTCFWGRCPHARAHQGHGFLVATVLCDLLVAACDTWGCVDMCLSQQVVKRIADTVVKGSRRSMCAVALQQCSVCCMVVMCLAVKVTASVVCRHCGICRHLGLRVIAGCCTAWHVGLLRRV